MAKQERQVGEVILILAIIHGSDLFLSTISEEVFLACAVEAGHINPRVSTLKNK